MLVAAGLLVAGCARAPAPTPPSVAPGRPAERLDRARRTAGALVRAVRERDRAAYASLTSDRDPSFASRARLLFDNLTALPLAELALTPEPGDRPLPAERQGVLGPEAWAQPVVVTWRLAGEDGAAQHRVWLTLVPAADGAQVAGTFDGPAARPPQQQPVWWLGPVTAWTRGAVSVVAGAGQRAERWFAVVQDAAAAVAAGLPAGVADRLGRVVVEVPATPADFAAVLGQPADRYAGIAAVVHPAGDGDRAPLRVVVNPRAGGLAAGALAEVVRHEVVHLATRSPVSPAPLWAVEGLAEWVALRAVPGRESPGTRGLLAAVRAGGAPRALPADPAFAAGGPDLDRAYAAAWLACRHVAGTYGVPRLGRLYAELDRGRSLDDAARRVLGVDAAALTEGWRRSLVRLAAGSR